ncbi:hypothetical protein EDC04DRAFT_479984 [Pisolithus marmoratus]|nr:hypothetical protein EDC04DRAFT_479984 [Pisolithus marmoratus]
MRKNFLRHFRACHIRACRSSLNPLMEEEEGIDLESGPIHSERNEEESDILLLQEQAEHEDVDPRSHSERNEQESDILSLQEQAEHEDVDPQSHSERNEQESDILSLHEQAEREGVEVQNGSPHTEEKLTIRSHVIGFGEVEEERDDVDPSNSSPKKGRNVFGIELQVVRTGPAVTEREDPDSQAHSFESEPKAYSIHATTDILSALPVLVSDSSVCKLVDNSSLSTSERKP